jgi:hypothetical protein
MTPTTTTTASVILNPQHIVNGRLNNNTINNSNTMSNSSSPMARKTPATLNTTSLIPEGLEVMAVNGGGGDVVGPAAGGSSPGSSSSASASAGGRRKKPCLSARERNVRRIESNERERLRMHGLNEAFQVRNTQK